MAGTPEPGPRLLLVSGSLRRESWNTRLLDDFAVRLTGRCRCERLAPEQLRLPLFDQDLEGDAEVMAAVVALHRRFSACHGIVVASPEYNGQITPALKNLVDWVSRLPHLSPAHGHAFVDRPVLLASASTGGSGGALSIPHARALFGYVGAVVLGDTVCVPHVAHSWTGGGFMFDDAAHEQIDGAIDRVLRLASAFAASTSSIATA